MRQSNKLGCRARCFAVEETRHIRAELNFLSTAQGGRSTPVETGYSPQFTYHGTGWSASHSFIGRERVHPGETAEAYLTFLTPPGIEYHGSRLHVGQDFTIQEGNRIVARGRVLEIIAQVPGLEHPAT